MPETSPAQSTPEFTRLAELAMKIVKSPNEVDYIAVVMLAPAAPEYAILYPFGGNEPGRTVDMDRVTSHVQVKCKEYSIEAFCKFDIDYKRNQIYGWYPLWDDSSQADRKNFGGAYLLFVSSTPVGAERFNAAIQLDGQNLFDLARSLLRPAG